MAVQRANRPPVWVIYEPQDAEKLCTELMHHSWVSVDSEWYDYDKNIGGNPVNNGLAACWTFAWREKTGDVKLAYLHNHGESANNVHILRPWWNSEKHHKLAHNCPVDWHMLANHGILGKKFHYDTLVMDFMVDENRENRHGLKACMADYYGIDRKSFNHTFGSPKLRKDGQPYATGQLIVPRLEDLLADPAWLDISRQTHCEWPTRFDDFVEYATDDAWDGLRLFEDLGDKLRAIPWTSTKNYFDYWYENESHITDIIQRMERRGMYVDVDFLKYQAEKCGRDLEELEARILEWAGCPLKLKGPQLQHLLYGVGMKPIFKGTGKNQKVLYQIPGKGWPVLQTTDGGAPSAAAETLVELAQHIERTHCATPEDLEGLRNVNQFNQFDKQRSTYLVGLVEAARGNRVHGRVNQTGATSSRFSMSDPNLQNITTGDKDVYHIRDAFCAPPGHTLLVGDWNGLEYRLLAHFTQDPELLRSFREGLDLHSLTCFNIYPHVKEAVIAKFGGPTKEALKWVAEAFNDDRKRAKTLNFEIIYGVGWKKLRDQLKLKDEEAKAMINGWFRGYPYVKVWMNRVLMSARQDGHIRRIDGGYRRPNMERLNNEEYWIRGEEERTIVNAAIQGSAAAMAKKTMRLIDSDEELRATGYVMIVQVHDEIIGECPIETYKSAIERVRIHMENPFSKPLRVPMPVSIGYGPSWATAKA